MMNIAINGLGRIGRNFLRCILLDPKADKKIKIAAINIGPARKDFVAHMVKYDTLMGTYPGTVKMTNQELIIDDHHIQVIAEEDPAQINWKQFNIDWVVESSGHFTTREGAHKHIIAGAKYVLITAPAKDEDVSIIPGVNEHIFDPKKDKIVSLGSCTTNAFIPMVKVLHDAFIIKQGFMTTIHAYTNSQVLLDVQAKDLRRSRAAALNIIPTTTGASEMLSKILPELKDLIPASAVRVPVAKVSLVDLMVVTDKKLTNDTIHAAYTKASESDMNGILALTMEALVSSDFAGSKYSVVVDGLMTQTQGNSARILGWYDNEWGYSQRLKDFLMYTLEI